MLTGSAFAASTLGFEFVGSTCGELGAMASSSTSSGGRSYKAGSKKRHFTILFDRLQRMPHSWAFPHLSQPSNCHVPGGDGARPEQKEKGTPNPQLTQDGLGPRKQPIPNSSTDFPSQRQTSAVDPIGRSTDAPRSVKGKSRHLILSPGISRGEVARAMNE